MRSFKIFNNSPHRHFGTPILVWTIALSRLAYWFVGGGWVYAVVIATTVLAVTGCLLQASHQRGSMCETCFAQMPLDASEQAMRRIGWLKHCHRVGKTRRRSQGILLGWVTVAMLNNYFLKGTAQHIVGDLLMVWLMAEAWSMRVHQRFSPWCPMCRHGGRGRGVETAAPAPTAPQLA
ncbi:hypothetical protein ACIRQO_36615 [Streptomyces anulatus]